MSRTLIFVNMDEAIIEELKRLCDFSYEIKDGSCTKISFYNPGNYGGSIRRNKRKHFIVERIAQFKHLKHLDLSKCKLGCMPTIRSSNLEHLNISGNDLDCFPDWISDLPIKHLNIGSNRIRHIPDLTQLPLEVLKLHKNLELQRMPSIGNQIKILNMFFLPNIQQIPEQVLHIKSLEVFTYGCTTAKVMPCLLTMPNLRWLTLAVNQYQKIDNGICCLQKLEGLILAKNLIVAIPDSINDLINLRSLSLYSNHITSLPQSLFRLNLNRLNLARNLLSDKDKQMVMDFGRNMNFLQV